MYIYATFRGPRKSPHPRVERPPPSDCRRAGKTAQEESLKIVKCICFFFITKLMLNFFFR